MAFDAAVADAAWIGEWITGRAIARGLPMPFPDRGGWRAEVGSDSELRRWIFPNLTPEMQTLAEEISDPRLKLRALARPDAMAASLPRGWQVEAPSFAMIAAHRADSEPSVTGDYRLEVQAEGRAVHVFAICATGELAAWGHGGASDNAFVFDRIVTRESHPRRGLGTAIMAALAQARPDISSARLLVATEAGRHLYEGIGWHVVAPYSSATWIGDSPVQK